MNSAALFQSTFPRGERQKDESAVGKPCKFQSTFPRGERQSDGQQISNSLLFQSTFPRGERQCGALFYAVDGYFNPRSRVGNDEALRNLLVGIMNFNPRSRVGNDGENLWRSQVLHHFNPRSRVGNDESLDRNCSTQCNFNPRSRVGNDFPRRLFRKIIRRFQSTFPRGERPNFHEINLDWLIFQSTFPRGERQQIFTNILCFFMQ